MIPFFFNNYNLFSLSLYLCLSPSLFLSLSQLKILYLYVSLSNKIIVLCVLYFSGPDLSPGVPSLTPQLYVQPGEDHQDQHTGHQQYAGYV